MLLVRDVLQRMRWMLLRVQEMRNRMGTRDEGRRIRRIIVLCWRWNRNGRGSLRGFRLRRLSLNVLLERSDLSFELSESIVVHCHSDTPLAVFQITQSPFDVVQSTTAKCNRNQLQLEIKRKLTDRSASSFFALPANPPAGGSNTQSIPMEVQRRQFAPTSPSHFIFCFRHAAQATDARVDGVARLSLVGLTSFLGIGARNPGLPGNVPDDSLVDLLDGPGGYAPCPFIFDVVR